MPVMERVNTGPRLLGRYTQPDRLAREVVALPGAAGSILVVDRLSGGLGDSRLVGHLDAGEDAGSAQTLCDLYLADPSRGRCRRLCRADLRSVPGPAPLTDPAVFDRVLGDSDGNSYRLSVLECAPWTLSWTCAPQSPCDPVEIVTVRDVIGRLEAYEPVPTMTRQAITACAGDIETRCIQRELDCVEHSSTVLNRGLREAVQHAITRHQSTLAEIAMRCGRLKPETRGHGSGETSWLARRIGQAPDSVTGRRTPWVHTDVLALIARDGLGVAPCEVEVG